MVSARRLPPCVAGAVDVAATVAGDLAPEPPFALDASDTLICAMAWALHGVHMPMASANSSAATNRPAAPFSNFFIH